MTPGNVFDEQRKATNELHDVLTIGETLYAVRRKPSRSDRSEFVQFFILKGKFRIEPIGREIALACNARFNQEIDGVNIHKPDTAAAIVARLGGRLFGKSDAFTLEWL